MTGLTVGALRDLLANLPADMPVRMGMNYEYEDFVNAVYISGGDTLYFDDVTAGLGPADGTSVLFNGNA